MAKFGKWIGAGLGWAFAGPLDAVLGFAFGSLIDTTQTDILSSDHTTTTGDFIASLLVLVAAVMKADGKVLKSELDYVKKYFLQAFGSETATEAVKMLRDILQQDIPVRDVCMQIRQRMDYSSRLQLLHFLFGIAGADGQVDQTELNLIILIADYLGIDIADVDSIKGMFVKSTDWAYKILEIDPSASEDEIKKAYRKMAVKFHPDKVSYLGEEFKNKANEKFQKINEAYEALKKEKGFR